MKVAIVGAGAAGLCCAHHFGNQSPQHFHVHVFEKNCEVGGTWIYEDNTSDLDTRIGSDGVHKAATHSSMYKNLRTNFPKEIMCFPDFPFNDQLPSFPHHSDVLNYLNLYANQHKLHQFIHFNSLVELVEPVHREPARMESGCVDVKCERTKDREFRDAVKWRVDILNLKTGERVSEIFDVVLICSGHFFKPFLPDITGLPSFPGQVVHSHVYRKPETFKDQLLLIIGNGYSGRDIMVDTASHAKTVYFCNRGEFLTCPLPPNVEQLPALSELKPDSRACFVNGEERHIDTIIVATGYEYIFPFLTKDSGVSVEGAKRIKPLYKYTFNAVHPSMAFIGMNTGVMPFPYFDLQVRWVMSIWTGEKSLPTNEQMITDDEESYQLRLRQGLPPHLAGHHLGVAQWDFYRELAQLGGSEYLNPEIEIIYSEWEKLRCADVMNYKHTNIVRDGGRYKFVPYIHH